MSPICWMRPRNTVAIGSAPWSLGRIRCPALNDCMGQAGTETSGLGCGGLQDGRVPGPFIPPGPPGPRWTHRHPYAAAFGEFRLKLPAEVSIHTNGGHHMAQSEGPQPSSFPGKCRVWVALLQAPTAHEGSSTRTVSTGPAGYLSSPRIIQSGEPVFPRISAPRGIDPRSPRKCCFPEPTPLRRWQPTAEVRRSLLANFAKGVGSRRSHSKDSGRDRPTAGYCDIAGPRPSPGFPKGLSV
jgi:hypothetical protein